MSLQGKIVEYIEQGRFICAMVLEEQNRRLRVVNQNGRDVNLPFSRIVHQSGGRFPAESRDEIEQILRETAEKRQHLMQEVNLAELWELTRESPEVSFTASFLAELAFGAGSGDDQVAAFLRCVFEDRLYFKYKDGMVIAHPPEVVEQLQTRQEKERQKEVLLTAGARGLMELAKGEVPNDFPERETCLRLVRDYYLFGNEAPESETARELLKRAHLTRPHDPFNLLVRAGVWHPHENIHLLRQQLPVEFAAEAITQADSLSEADPETLIAAGHRDLRHLPLLTIDGESTRDYDDALHLEKRGENYLVGIHVTDVAHFVKPGDPLYMEAVRRATSIYLPDRQIPMLPPFISEGICSLIAGRPRAALSFLVLLSPRGEVVDFDIISSLVTVKRQLSYPRADQMISHDEELRILAALSLELRQRRLEKGAMLLPIPDVDIRIGPDEEIEIALSDVDTPARTLVAEFMVLANSLGAQLVADRQAPGLFRSQEPPRKIISSGLEKDLLVNFMQRRCLAPGRLGTAPLPHSGVGVMMYTTVTSPIRRLLDLIMQHQIKSLIRGRGALFSDSELQDLAGVITSTQGRVGLVRQLRCRYWILRFLEKHRGERFEALVLARGPKRVQVLLSELLLESDLPLPQARVHAGARVDVAIGQVSALDDFLRLEW
jgi:exoribonuclease II